MKKLFTLFTVFSVSYGAYTQCTPVNCLSTLPPYGGICDTLLIDGVVNQTYSDFESFHITTACFDAGLIDPNNAGIGIKITSLHTFTFTNLPVGITGASNQPIYNSPANGCVSFSGIPTQIGLFKPTANFQANVIAYPFGGGSCTGFSVNQNNNNASYGLWLKIKPDPSFNLPNNTYCLYDSPVTINITGTSGGTLSGPGVTGSTFDPSAAGIGTHVIKYVVSAQEGSAVAPASDSAFFTVQVTAPPYTYYQDMDGDGYGNSSVSVQSCNSTPPSQYTSNNQDCNDMDASINPSATEIPSNGIDEDCDGFDGIVDVDNDGYNNIVDCNDNDPAINPGATEICDGIDNNCDGSIDESFTLYTYYLDADGDGYGSNTSITSCSTTPPANYVINNTDCDDNNASVHPSLTEICDGLDNNCNGQIDEGLTITTYYLDSDLDGYGVASTTLDTCATSAPTGYAALAGDCDDSNPNINPGVSELCDGIDNNCNGNADENLTLNTYYEDADGDGYGNPNSTIQNCGPVTGYVDNNQDCNDGNIFINPSVLDPFGNSIDENCDGVDGNLSINNSLQALGIKVFPNPADNLIQLSGNLNGTSQVRIFNIQGQLIADKIIILQGVVELNVEEFQPGSYMLEISHPDSGLRGFTKLLIIR